jgi:hypothetical protein
MPDPQLQPRASRVAELYETFPYPPVGLFSGFFQRIRWEERQTLNYKALFGTSFGSVEGAAERPRILVAGCGTFEPIVVALANPGAEIVAVDLSGRSIQLLKRQAKIRGCAGRIFALQADIQDLPDSLGTFDFIVATGVIHHLADPLAGLRALVAHSSERAIFRFMIYSYWGRALLYAAKNLALELGIESPKEFRKMMESLPPRHPYRVYFHLYADSTTDTGISDGFLHPCDNAFTAKALRETLLKTGLEAAFFLHAPEGQPDAASSFAKVPDAADAWDRLSLLEVYGELQENFRFVARRKGSYYVPGDGFEWNEALPSKGMLFSTQLGKQVRFHKAALPSSLGQERCAELAKGLFLIPKRENK